MKKVGNEENTVNIKKYTNQVENGNKENTNTVNVKKYTNQVENANKEKKVLSLT